MREALPFLRQWYGECPPQLTAITPDGPILAQRDRGWDDTAKFVIAHNGSRNLYYSVNVVRTDKIGKASKGDITHALGCHCDIDYRVGEPPEEERQRILAMLQSVAPKPTATIFSGGGFNAVWKYRVPLPLTNADLIEDVEAANRALEYALGGDHCHNIDRILRLVSTWNLPNKRKVAKGRTKALAEIVEQDWSRLYSLDDFPKVLPRGVVPMRDRNGNAAPPVVISPVLPKSFADIGIPDHVRLQQVILHGKEMLGGKQFPSRSEAVWYVVNELIRCGVPDEKIVGVLLHPKLAISASVREKPDPATYAARQVTEARQKEAHSEYVIDREAEAAYEQL